MKKLFILSIVSFCSSIILSCNTENNANYVFPKSSDCTTKVLAYETFVKNCVNTRDNTEIYPYHYGGAFLSENGNLIVKTTDLTPENQQDILNQFGVDDITFIECEYSYNDLLNVKSQIDDYLIRNSQTEKLDNIQSVYIDVQKNRVVVCLDSCLENDIAKFKSEIYSSELIEFEEHKNISNGENKTTKARFNKQSHVINVNLSTGNLLCDNHSNLDSLTYASVAYRAQHNSGIKGFVTSANIAKYYGETIYSCIGLKIPVAMTMLSKQQDDINAAFCQLTGATIDNNLLYNNAYFTYSTVAPPQPNAFMPGNTVLFYGANAMSSNNNLPISSSIYGANCTVVGYNNVTYTGLIMSRYLTQNGADCGGLVAGLYAIRQLRVYGIHLITIGSNSYFIPAYTINQEFNLSIY